MKYEYTKDVVCPFFVTQHISSSIVDLKTDKRARKQRCTIKCEGIYKKTSTIIEFSDENARKEHKKNFCASFCYKECPIAIMISKKYGGNL